MVPIFGGYMAFGGYVSFEMGSIESYCIAVGCVGM